MVTVPATVAPFAGAVMLSRSEVGTGVGVGVGVPTPVGVTVGVEVLLGTGVAVGVGVLVGVGAVPPFWTFTVTETVPTCTLLLLYARAEIVWFPFATRVEFQAKLNGGDDAR
jgi:hypothetical protein